MSVIVHGYQYSVYHWIVRLALEEKSVSYETIELNPFSDNLPTSYLGLHPFGRVPVLVHDGFEVYETAAILRYIDGAFMGVQLVPEGLKDATRMAQAISIIDNYGYWPLVRQVFSQRVFRPSEGIPGDEEEISQGLTSAKRVLSVLDQIASEGRVLNGQTISLADVHLAPMIGYFVHTDEGKALFNSYNALSEWWNFVERRASFLSTNPGLPSG